VPSEHDEAEAAVIYDRWLRFGYNSRYFPFRHLPSEGLVGKSFFLLLT
jgi:hypothetical protein